MHAEDRSSTILNDISIHNMPYIREIMNVFPQFNIKRYPYCEEEF